MTQAFGRAAGVGGAGGERSQLKMISDSVVFMRTGVLAFLLLAFSLGPGSNAWAQSRRVPAEWEPQEALWLQWPGPFEQTYVTAYAEITKVVAQYQPIRILHHTNRIKTKARSAIADAGGVIFLPTAQRAKPTLAAGPSLSRHRAVARRKGASAPSGR